MMEAAPARPEIILPVFNALAMLRAALDSLLRTLGPEDRVTLLDDASNEAGIADAMEAFRRDAGFAVRIVRNEHNQGFVRTVNRGMALTTHDVVLLNSDTIATSGWLDRIVAAAASDPWIATVTPFSNNAEICSLPDFCRNNPVPAEPERVAAGLAAGRPEYPDLPTAVGFCMFIRRRALTELGDFDAATFGRGYGEENDFCMRATAHGWRHVLCDDAYVVHQGGASFSLTGERPGGEALRRLIARYPGYNARVADFIRADPLAAIRKAAWARISAS